MKRIALAVVLLVWSAVAVLAQNVTVIGPITPGDCPQFSSTTIIKDSGFNCNGAPAVPFANPTGAVGLSTVNGAATTATRSDAAPPLSSAVQTALTGTNNAQLVGTGAFGFASVCTPATAGSFCYWNGSNWTLLAGNTSSTNVLSENGSGVPAWIAQGGVAAASLPGAVVNLKASVAAAGATVTPTADAVIVCTALNGTCYSLASYSQAFNGAGTGAGGMDTGAIPTSSWLALYAIYNPSGPTVSILGKTCAVSCPTIYNGANMPSGFTASALLTVLPTNATPAIAISFAIGRKVMFGVVQLLNSASASSACTAVSLTTAVPPNAVKVSGLMFVSFASNAAASNFNMFVYGESTCTIGFQAVGSALPITAGAATLQAPFTDLELPTAQSMWAGWANTGTTPSTKVNITSYSIPEAQ